MAEKPAAKPAPPDPRLDYIKEKVLASLKLPATSYEKFQSVEGRCVARDLGKESLRRALPVEEPFMSCKSNVA